MVDRSRDNFNSAAALTMDVRIGKLPENEQQRMADISREAEEKKSQLKQEQEQNRQQDIDAEKAKLLLQQKTLEHTPPGMVPNFRERNERAEKQAEYNVDFRNEQEIAKIEDQKKNDIEREVGRAEKGQEKEQEKEPGQKRAEELEKAAQRVREFQERNSREHGRSR